MHRDHSLEATWHHDCRGNVSKGYGVEPYTQSPRGSILRPLRTSLPLTPQRPQAASPASSTTDAMPVPLKLGGIGGAAPTPAAPAGNNPRNGSLGDGLGRLLLSTQTAFNFPLISLWWVSSPGGGQLPQRVPTAGRGSRRELGEVDLASGGAFAAP